MFPVIANATVWNDGPHSNYQITVTSDTGRHVTDVASRIGCTTDTFGHHNFYVNNQLKAWATDGWINGGTISVAGWHPNLTYSAGTDFKNLWAWGSGCTPQGASHVTI